MDLNEQAQRALMALQSDPRLPLGDWPVIARMMWLEGFKAGMETTHAIAEQSFAKLEAEIS